MKYAKLKPTINLEDSYKITPVLAVPEKKVPDGTRAG
jgi:hypothetical protein